MKEERRVRNKTSERYNRSQEKSQCCGGPKSRSGLKERRWARRKLEEEAAEVVEVEGSDGEELREPLCVPPIAESKVRLAHLN